MAGIDDWDQGWVFVYEYFICVVFGLKHVLVSLGGSIRIILLKILKWARLQMPWRAAIRWPLAVHLHVGYSRDEIARLIEICPLDLFLVNHLILLWHLARVLGWRRRLLVAAALDYKLSLGNGGWWTSDHVVIGGGASSLEGRILIDLFVVFDVHLVELLLQERHLLLEVVDVPLLVSALLGVSGGSHEIFESNWITWYLRAIWHRIWSREEAFSFQQINSVESIVSPAFTNFKIGWELSDNLQSLWITIVKHLDSVLIFGCLA